MRARPLREEHDIPAARRSARGPRLAGPARLLIASALAMLGVLLVGCDRPPAAPQEGPQVWLEPTPRAPAADFRLLVEHWSERHVAELRRRENLDAVVAGTESDLDEFMRLMSWTNAQWAIGTPKPYPNSNAIAILDAIRAGRTGGFCAQYAFVLQDAIKSLGHWAVRTVELESVEGQGHVVVEAYSSAANAWVVFDPTFDVRYTDADGRPLSALGVHRCYWEHRPVRIVPGTAPRRPGQSPEDIPGDPAARFARLAVALRSDLAQLDRPLTMPEREKMFLRWDAGASRGGTFEHLDFKLSSSRENDLYPPMGQVFIESARRLSARTGERWRIELSTRGTWPHFKTHEMRVQGGPWTPVPPTMVIDATRARHVQLRAVNVGLVAGPVFTLHLPPNR